MSDIVRTQGQGVPKDMKTRIRDMHDGTHADIVSAVLFDSEVQLIDSEVRLVEGDAHVGEVDLALGTEVDLVAGAEVGLVEGTGVYLIDLDGNVFGLRQTGNQIRVINTPYGYQIAEGNVADHVAVCLFGHNPDVGTGWETVSHIDALMYYPAVAETLIARSDDADDDGAPLGTGAQTIYVVGLDNAWGLINDTITLNGTTNVNFNVDMLRVLFARVLTAGATGTNDGEITIYGADSTSKILSIYDGEGWSHSASYSVPAGQTFYLKDLFISDASLKGADIALFVRPFGGLWHMQYSFQMLDEGSEIPESFPAPFLERSDLEWRAMALAAGAVVGIKFGGWIES